jgi:hypothetical protein
MTAAASRKPPNLKSALPRRMVSGDGGGGGVCVCAEAQRGNRRQQPTRLMWVIPVVMVG